MLGGTPLPATASMKIWAQGSEDSIIRQLQWHSIAAAQLTHILGERASELAEDVEWERTLKQVAIDTARDKVKEVEVADQKAQTLETAQQLVEERLAEIEGRVRDTELKLATAESLNLVRDKEVAELNLRLPWRPLRPNGLLLSGSTCLHPAIPSLSPSSSYTQSPSPIANSVIAIKGSLVTGIPAWPDPSGRFVLFSN
nr:hypothetical protein CFP56_27387 [Quercus suber]